MARKTVGILFSVLSLTGSLTPAFAQQAQTPNYGPHMWNGGWHGWFFGPLMMIAWIAIAVVVVILFLRWHGGPKRGSPQYDRPVQTPLDILKERYAKGEIDREEFEERRRILDE